MRTMLGWGAIVASVTMALTACLSIYEHSIGPTDNEGSQALICAFVDTAIPIQGIMGLLIFGPLAQSIFGRSRRRWQNVGLCVAIALNAFTSLAISPFATYVWTAWYRYYKWGT